jgi:hypothetical protein
VEKVIRGNHGGLSHSQVEGVRDAIAFDDGVGKVAGSVDAEGEGCYDVL